MTATAIGLGLLTFNKSQVQAAATSKPAKTNEYKAHAVEVLNKSGEMRAHKSKLLGATSGPVGQEGIPEVIKIGDTVTVKGETIRVQLILVTEHLVDMRYGSELLAKKGDVRCVAVESQENLPWVDEGIERNRLWISIDQCRPLQKEEGSCAH